MEAPPHRWRLAFQYSDVFLQGRVVVLSRTVRLQGVTGDRVQCPHVPFTSSFLSCLLTLAQTSRPYGQIPSPLILIRVFLRGVASSLHTHAVCGADSEEPGLVSPPPTFVRLCGPVILWVDPLFRGCPIPSHVQVSVLLTFPWVQCTPLRVHNPHVQCQHSGVSVTFRSLSCRAVHSLVSQYFLPNEAQKGPWRCPAWWNLGIADSCCALRAARSSHLQWVIRSALVG